MLQSLKSRFESLVLFGEVEPDVAVFRLFEEARTRYCSHADFFRKLFTESARYLYLLAISGWKNSFSFSVHVMKKQAMAFVFLIQDMILSAASSKTSNSPMG